MSYLGLDPRQQLLNASTQYFSGNASAIQFTLARNVASASDLDVLIGNVAQRPGIDYIAGNVSLVFTNPPASGTNNITVTFRGGALNSLDLSASVFEAGTVGEPSVVSVAANNTGFYWANATTLVATVAGANRATFNGTAASTSNVTGALTVTGGIGATGNINTSGLIRTTNTTESANVGSGALVVGGGAGITGNLNVGGDITCVGDFTVNGTFTTTGTDSLEVNDPFIFLANANPGDSFDIGTIGQYNDGTDRYTGIFRDITDGAYKIFSNLTVRPTTVVDTADASFVLADLELGTVSATGNITGNYFFGNGSQLTGLVASVSEIINGDSKVEIPSINGAIIANVNGATKANISAAGLAVTGNISASILISATGNVIGGNITTAGLITATGNITSAANISAGNISTGGLISAINTITGGNLATAGTASAAGNVTGGNIVTAGQVTAGANVTGGNIKTAGLVSAAGDVYGLGGLFTTLSATGNVDGGNINTAAVVSAVGNVVGGNLVSAGKANVSSVEAATTVSATGNVIGGNVNTGGIVSATANVIGGNLVSAGKANVSSVEATNTVSAGGNVTGGNITTGGVVTATGNIDGGNVNTAIVSATGAVIATGNVSGGNLNTAGLVSATANVIGGNVSTGGIITATGNITGGNITTGGLITATGSIQATANVVGGNINTVGLVSAGGSVSATGNVTGGNITTAGIITATGNVISAANVAGGNVLATGNVNTAQISATGNIVAIANITGGNLLASTLSLSGNVVSELSITSNVTAGNLRSAGIVSAVGNIIGANISTGGLITATGNVTGGNINTGGLVSATGNLSGANILASGNVGIQTPDPRAPLQLAYTAGVPAAALLTTDAAIITANASAPGFAFVVSSATASQRGVFKGTRSRGTLESPTVPSSGDSVVSFLGAIYDSSAPLATAAIDFKVGGTVSAGVAPQELDFLTGETNSRTSRLTIYANGVVNVKSTTASTSTTTGALIVGGGIGAAGNINGGNLSVGIGTLTVGNIVNSNGNAVGNIGSSSTYFNTVFAKATSAQYADLAEMYVADQDYEPGTVVAFGGEQEITISSQPEDTRVAGVVSTNPSYLMNATQAGEHVVAVALTGRVPTRVVGAVRKGDLMVSAGDGAARSQTEPRTGSVIGKALQDHDGGSGMIEIVVGRL